MTTLTVDNLKVAVDKKLILHGVSLTLRSGEVHAIMGPNGTGKSTLAGAIMGDPRYEVVAGDIQLDGKSIVGLPVDERARLGIFMGMQLPVAVPGVTLSTLIRAALRAKEGKVQLLDYMRKLKRALALLDMPPEMANRDLNVGFSGGEQKRAELLQLMMLTPAVALLDEIDSGLDIDALKVVARGINAMRGPHFAGLLITHYQRLLTYVQPDFVHVMMGGRIVKTGGAAVATELEQKGYTRIRDELGLDIPLVDEGV